MRLLAATALFMVLATAANAADCKLHLIASLPLVEDTSGGPMVPATLGDKRTVMLVDTGGTFSMVAQHIVDALKPDVARVAGNHFTLVNNKEIKQIAHIRPFALGEMTTHEFQFLVLPDGLVGPKSLDGTIAPDILANFDVEFDFAGKKMNLFSQDHCPGNVVYWTKDWAEIPFRSPDNLHIELKMMLDDEPVEATLDTGSSRSYLNASVAERMFSLKGEDPDKAFGHTFKSLSTNGVSFANPQFVILSDKRSAGIGHYGTMLLGMTELRHFHLYIAYKEQVLYVTPADAH